MRDSINPAASAIDADGSTAMTGEVIIDEACTVVSFEIVTSSACRQGPTTAWND
ncbi:hypothetical protein [Mesorhizobium intechi]|uniref:hypothetical protein n=1 Tax=Mesorhizobium intechi TaxID=537601 RepID=UPI001FEA7734|nr:hypothetical protein [Mesorhizobium intechi]